MFDRMSHSPDHVVKILLKDGKAIVHKACPNPAMEEWYFFQGDIKDGLWLIKCPVLEGSNLFGSTSKLNEHWRKLIVYYKLPMIRFFGVGRLNADKNMEFSYKLEVGK